MGKGKNQKRKVNVFKVSSGRSAKAKNKIKLDVNRKNVSEQNKQKIESIDQQLFSLSEKIRQLPQLKNDNSSKNSHVTISSSKLQEIQLYEAAQQNCEEALEKLNSFTM